MWNCELRRRKSVYGPIFRQEDRLLHFLKVNYVLTRILINEHKYQIASRLIIVGNREIVTATVYRTLGN